MNVKLKKTPTEKLFYHDMFKFALAIEGHPSPLTYSSTVIKTENGYLHRFNGDKFHIIVDDIGNFRAILSPGMPEAQVLREGHLVEVAKAFDTQQSRDFSGFERGLKSIQKCFSDSNKKVYRYEYWAESPVLIQADAVPRLNFELVLANFDGATDATDALILWVGAESQAQIAQFIEDSGLSDLVRISGELPSELDKVDGVDFQMPGQAVELKAEIEGLIERHLASNDVPASPKH